MRLWVTGGLGTGDRFAHRTALAARRYWEIAGTWTNVERAEYRLAMTHVALGEIAEVTMEANPESCDDRVFQTARAAGVDRISLGVQSFDVRAYLLPHFANQFDTG